MLVLKFQRSAVLRKEAKSPSVLQLLSGTRVFSPFVLSSLIGADEGLIGGFFSSIEQDSMSKVNERLWMNKRVLFQQDGGDGGKLRIPLCFWLSLNFPLSLACRYLKSGLGAQR